MPPVYYLYMLYESPIEKPYYCKIGYSADPVCRLDQLQAGNPRRLRCCDFSRRPTKPFGFELPSEEHAKALEKRIHDRLEGMGLRIYRDMNYETFKAPAREWFEKMHPDQVWALMTKMYVDYCHENSLYLEQIYLGANPRRKNET